MGEVKMGRAGPTWPINDPYLGNLGRRTMKGSSWKNLQPSREGIDSLGKNDKGKNNQKTESEKVRFRSLEGREFGGQLSKDALEWKVSKRLLEKKSTKRRKL